MQINLTGHHVEITDSLRNYVDTKFSKLERHFDHISNVHVILNVEKLNQKAEATVHLSGAEVWTAPSVRFSVIVKSEFLRSSLILPPSKTRTSIRRQYSTV